MNTVRGFSILELMVVVAIAAILLTVGVPSFQTLVFNNRITTEINRFSGSLAIARSEAVKVNTRVVVCPTSDGASCDKDADWENGWLTYIERNRTQDPPQVDDNSGGNPADDPCGINAGDDDEDDCILQVVPAMQGASITLNSTANAEDRIWYNGLGASNVAAQWIICDERGVESAKGINISATGRASIHTAKLNGAALDSCTPPF